MTAECPFAIFVNFDPKHQPAFSDCLKDMSSTGVLITEVRVFDENLGYAIVEQMNISIGTFILKLKKIMRETLVKF